MPAIRFRMWALAGTSSPRCNSFAGRIGSGASFDAESRTDVSGF
jgi:hypothetical protein